jgi:DNA-binding transcriptional regulator GbsR (MarR family)
LVETTVKSRKSARMTPRATGGSLSSNGSNGVREAASRKALNAFQLQAVSFFVHAFAALSLPRSIGEIYGLLFSTEEALSLDDIIERLRISKGSASEGLRWLRSLGAVNPVYLPGVRKEHFTAETSLRKLATGYLRDRIHPHLENGPERLRLLQESVVEGAAESSFQKSRTNQIAGWYKFMGRVLPLVKALAGKF